MSVVSGPMVPGSSGALPGQSSTTRGASPARTGQARHSSAITHAVRFMVAPRDEGRPKVPEHTTAAYHDREGVNAVFVDGVPALCDRHGDRSRGGTRILDVVLPSERNSIHANH